MTETNDNKTEEKRSETLQEELFYPDSKREPGDANRELFGGRLDIHPVVLPVSLTVIGLFIVVTLLFQQLAALVGLRSDSGETMTAVEAFGTLQALGTDTFDWLLILAMNAAIIAVVYFALSKYGRIRIGGVNAEKEFSNFAWIAMLFSAGMGIGLIVFSVSETMYGLQTVPPYFAGVEPETSAAGHAAVVQNFFHWGLAPWGIYALVGLGLGFFAYNRGLPLTFRSIFWPVLGKRIYGWPGHVIDILAVFATLFGLATSLGLGAQQATTGVVYVSDQLFGITIPETTSTQVVLIAVITLIAAGSVAAGLEKGVKRLSNINAVFMVVMLAFLLIAGPTLYLLGGFSSALGTYTNSLIELSFFTGTFGGEGATEWLGNWTFFYWAWWIAWSPFVGMFIARISKGRTIREFVGGVLLVPTFFGIFWFSTLGGSAVYAQLNGGGLLTVLNEQGQEAVMYAMLSEYPLGLVMSILATILVMTIFVTSSDSGSLVIDQLTAGGKHDAPKVQRILWALIEGGIAAVLLIGGGLTALQAASIATGIPFALVLLFMCYAIYRGLNHEHEILESSEYQRRRKEMIEQGEIEVDTSDDGIVTSGGDSISDIKKDESTMSDD
ncbi:BCCT family transporter [Natrinema versiforme]|uniref:BCCT family transporter n=1 Tax=Natrinema versiforme TaxID=88724 RepID=A0A4P8WQC1_9EURY|nr:BCCT family transporter [Natrinema versiforme]QCS44713.1 BCCT family transporter [Natrinema versiforme]